MNPISTQDGSELHDNFENVGGFQYNSSMGELRSSSESSVLPSPSIYSPNRLDRHVFDMSSSSCGVSTRNAVAGDPTSTLQHPQEQPMGSNMNNLMYNAPISHISNFPERNSILKSPTSLERYGMSVGEQYAFVDSSASNPSFYTKGMPSSSNFVPMPTDDPRTNAWTKDQEEFLMASRKNNTTYAQIRADMHVLFGVDRNPNVLSKRSQTIQRREAEDSEILQLLESALPSLLQVLQDEMNKVDPQIMGEDMRRGVLNGLRRKFPAFIRNLALQSQTQTRA